MSGRASIANGDLCGLDALDVDALALVLWEGRTQPRGVAGFVDWRLLGKVAHLILDAQFLGHRGEALLMPGAGGIGARRIFLFGMGAIEAASEVALHAALEGICRVLADACAVSIAFAPPTVEDAMEAGDNAARRECMEPSKVASAWLEVARVGGASFEDLVLLDVGGKLVQSEATLAKTAKKLGYVWGVKR